MKSNTTPIWFVLAAALAAAVWFVTKHLQPATPAENALLAGLRAADVTAIQISPAGEREISVSRTNQDWFLNLPVAYPAQTAAIAALLSTLEKLTPALRLGPAEVASKNADEEFGLDNPQFRIDIAAGDQSWHVNVGRKTAPGDGVYVRLVGGAGIYVTDIGWLQSLPQDAAVWRDTSLVRNADDIDWLVITNGAKAIELRRDPTNRLWHMLSPLQTRADGAYITTALRQLLAAKVTRFVTDDPKADLTGYGLQPASLDVWLGHGTNLTDGFDAGKAVPDNTGNVFARREGWDSVLSVPKEALLPWLGNVNDFRDPLLLAYTAPIAEIVVQGKNNFTFRKSGAGVWEQVGEKFPVDMESLQSYVQLLFGLRVSEFTKDAATETDLQNHGLAPTNSGSITLLAVPGDTNSIISQIIFGATETNKVFVKRGDENCIFAVSLQDLGQLPDYGWKLRERRIWNFSQTNVAQITVRQGGQIRQVVHNGFNKWSLAPGSQGMVDPVGLEETANQFSSLTAPAWVDRNAINFTPDKLGFNPTNTLQIEFELKTGEKRVVDLGSEIKLGSDTTAIAAVTLEGDRWSFLFPPILYQLIAAYLTIPAGTP